jgi:probable F420-dependent oxidoreductase
MKFGIATFLTDQSIGPVDLGRALEERRFESLFLPEHTHIPVNRESPYPGGGELPEFYYGTLDPFVALTAAAVVTERLVVATGIALLVERDPIITAKETATLDLVSGGRLLFGVGAGWNLEEMRNHGTDPATRGALLDERLQAVKLLWTEETPEFHGKYVDFGPVYMRPKPVQRPHPPIYIGGDSPATMRRVVRYGDGWMANALPVDRMAARIAELRDRAGRDVPVSVFGAPPDVDLLRAYQGLGIERVTLFLPTRPRDEALALLDEFAALIAQLV